VQTYSSASCSRAHDFLEYQTRGFTPTRTRLRIIDSNIRQRAKELKGFPNIATTTPLYLTKGQPVPGLENSIAYRSHRKEKKGRQRKHKDTRRYRALHMYRLLQKLVIFLLGQWGKVKMNAEDGWQEAMQADARAISRVDVELVGPAFLSILRGSCDVNGCITTGSSLDHIAMYSVLLFRHLHPT
jgi:hypothetical protein